MRKMRVAVLMGGDSAEREVSYASGTAVVQALDPSALDVIPVVWNGALTAASTTGSHSPGERDLGVVPITVTSSSLLESLLRLQPDVVFIALHGGSGENGHLQAVLDKAGLRYTGSGPVASALGMDKVASKQLFSQWGIESPEGVCLLGTELDAIGPQVYPLLVQQFGLPLVTKPAGGGSSVGVTIVREADRLPDALRHALAFDTRVLIEQYVAGTEITAGLLSEGDDVRVLPLIEIVPKSPSGFYDYEAKYTPGMSEHLIPPRLDESVQDALRKAAAEAYRGLGCRGMARADFMVTGDGHPVLFEMNTVPGLTQTSLVPDAARAAGIIFPELVRRLIREASHD